MQAYLQRQWHAATALLVLLVLLVPPLQSLRDFPDIGRDPHIPDYSPHYYYKSTKEKITESLSVSNCTVLSKSFAMSEGYNPPEGKQPDVFITVIRPKASVMKRWKSIIASQGQSANVSESHAIGDSKTFRQFIQITDNLCKSDLFAKFKAGHYARSKGCIKMMQLDNNKKPYKIVNPYGATLHPDHSRCNFKKSAEQCVTGSLRPTVLDSPDRANTQFPFIARFRNAIVARSGMVAMPCGVFGYFSSCESVNWGLAAAIDAYPHVHECHPDFAKGQGNQPNQLNQLNQPQQADAHHHTDCPFKKVDRIFLTSQYDDTQIGQFILESLPRLIYHLDFLYENPDIKIHYGFTKQPVLPKDVLPHQFFRWLGLHDRLVNGTVFAKEVYMPREGACQEPGYNMWELFNMREVLLAKGVEEIGTGGRNNSKGWPSASFGTEDLLLKENDLQNDGNANNSKPLILLLKRSASPYTKNQNDYTRRRWPGRHGGAGVVRAHLMRAFPSHNVQIFSDLDEELMRCLPCQAQLFNRASIVVAMHGAGLTNTIYMNPGGVVVECVPNFDARMAPIVGIFPRLSAIAGLHHFTYWIPDNAGFSPEALANASRSFYDNVQLWH